MAMQPWPKNRRHIINWPAVRLYWEIFAVVAHAFVVQHLRNNGALEAYAATGTIKFKILESLSVKRCADH